MNSLTQVKNLQKITAREAAAGVSEEASWHAHYKDSAYIFIGGLPYDIAEGDVLAVFAQYGEIMDLNLVRDKGTGKSKGFSFLAYEDQRSTILAIISMGPRFWDEPFVLIMWPIIKRKNRTMKRKNRGKGKNEVYVMHFKGESAIVEMPAGFHKMHFARKAYRLLSQKISNINFLNLLEGCCPPICNLHGTLSHKAHD